MDQQSCFSFIWMFLQENLYYLRKQKIYEISCKREDTWLLLWKYSGIRLEMFHCNCLLFFPWQYEKLLSKVGYFSKIEESRKIYEIFCKRADTLNEERVNAKRIAKHCTAHSKGEKLVVPAERAIFQVRKCIWFDFKWQEYELKLERAKKMSIKVWKYYYLVQIYWTFK